MRRALCVTLLLAAAPLHAEVSAADPDGILASIRAYGQKAKLETGDDGVPFITVNMDGINYYVDFYGCTDQGTGCEDIQFNASFEMDKPLTAQFANQWNRDWAVGRVYVNDAGNPTLTYYVPLLGGVPDQTFTNTLDQWTGVLNQFLGDIDW